MIMDRREPNELQTTAHKDGNKAQAGSLSLHAALTQLLLRDVLDLTTITDAYVCASVDVCVCE